MLLALLAPVHAEVSGVCVHLDVLGCRASVRDDVLLEVRAERDVQQLLWPLEPLVRVCPVLGEDRGFLLRRSPARHRVLVAEDDLQLSEQSVRRCRRWDRCTSSVSRLCD